MTAVTGIITKQAPRFFNLEAKRRSRREALLAMADILKILEPLISRINATMSEMIARDEEIVARIGRYSFEGGGKRLRPLMFCLMYEALGGELTPARLETSTAFEFLHMATLLHDDIVDVAEVRRGRPAAHLAFGVPEAVLAGDYLLSKAAVIGSETANLECIKALSWVVGALSLGELVQLGSRRQVNLSEEDYFKIIYRKTAVLMEGATKAAAILSGAEGETLEAASLYGRQFGLAFQIVDDILDYQGDQTTFGKPVGHDLDEGKITLPFIRAREALGDEARNHLRDLAEHENISPEDREEIIALVGRGGGVASARLKADELIHEAIRALHALKPSVARDRLEALALYTVSRTY